MSAENFLFSKVDLSKDITDFLISLMMHGECETHKDYYKSHSKSVIKIVVLEVHQLKATLLKNDALEYPEPKFGNEIKTYKTTQHMNHNVYIAPSHVELIDRLEKVTDDHELHDAKVKIGLMLVKNGGCITFPLPH